MSKKFFISYGDKNYSIQRKRIGYQAKMFDFFDEVIIYNKRDLTKDFCQRFSNILTYSTGGGFWIWKSQIILQTLNMMNEDDILLYVDSGSSLNIKGKKRLIEYFDMFSASSENIFLFRIPSQYIGLETTPKLKEKNWTVKEIFEHFSVAGDPKITDTQQFMGGVMLVKKNNKSLKFFHDFQNTVEENNNLITNFYDENQMDDFIRNRHDQSILSVMGKIYGCYFIDDESFYFYNPSGQFESPILTVRDGYYNNWQKFKYYILYPLNIRKVIFFKQKPFYFKNKNTLYSRLIKRISNFSD